MSDTPFDDILWKTEDECARDDAAQDLIEIASLVAKAKGTRLAWIKAEIRALKQNLERVPQFSKRRDV